MINEDIRNHIHTSRVLSNDLSFRLFGDAVQAETTVIILLNARGIVELERLLEIELGIQHLRGLARLS